jgi:hypothetical protein
MSIPPLPAYGTSGPDRLAGVLCRAGEVLLSGEWHELPSGVISVPISLRLSPSAAAAAAAPFAGAGSQYALRNTKVSFDGSSLSVNLSAIQCSSQHLASSASADEQIPVPNQSNKSREK